MGSERHTSPGRQTLLILGASGDLTARLLLPGLGDLQRVLTEVADGAPDLALVGSDRVRGEEAHWRGQVAAAFAAAGAAGPGVDSVVENARYIAGDVTVEADLERVLAACTPPLAIVFALPPAVTMRACRTMERIGLAPGTRLVLEKPFGTDAAGAQHLNSVLARLVPEDQIHRVDHFLGKSTVLNILGLRFANRILEPVLNRDHVDSVEIVFAESLALEGRAGYYDRAGALIDMIQSHLLQVLALLTMDAPATLRSQDLRDRKAATLRATRVWADDPVSWSRRARYTAGDIDGRRLPSYVDEPGVDPGRDTETFAEVTLTVDTPRWAGVPFRLSSGKALAHPREEAIVTFKHPPQLPDGLTGYTCPDRLRIGFAPDCLRLDLNINGPGDPFVIDPITLEADFGPGELTAYGEVLRGVLRSDPTLSVRADTVEDCWRIVEPVLKAWREHQVPMLEYPAGSEIALNSAGSGLEFLAAHRSHQEDVASSDTRRG